MESESVALPPTRADAQARDGSPALPPPPPANLRGFLKKQGPGFSSKWQLRWFEQKGNRLYYYKPSSLSFSITSADLGDADAGELDLTIDDNSDSNPSSPSLSSPRATSPPTRSLSFRKSGGGGGINVSSGRGMKEIAESDKKKKEKKEKKEKTNKNKKEDGDESDDVGGGENGNDADGGGGDGDGDDDSDDGDEERPPMPNPRGFIELRKVSAIAGRANDINAAKNLEKYHFYLDLYTAERVFRLAASTEEHYLYWNEGLKRWKRHTSSLLPPLQLTPPLSASPGIPSSFGSDTSSSSSSPSPTSSSSSLSTSSSSLSVGLLAPSPNSPLYSPFSLALPPQPTYVSSSPSSSLSPMSSPAAQRLADLALDARDEPDWTRKNTKFGYTSVRGDRASSHRRGLGLGTMGSGGRPLSAVAVAEDKQLRRGLSVRSTRDFMLRTQPLPSSASSASMPSLPLLAPAASDDRSRELLLEREKDLQELLALKDKEIAQLKELARERPQTEVEPARASNSSDAVLTQRKATNFIGTRGGPAPTPTMPTPTPDAAALRVASEEARRLADELARERSEGLQWRIAAKETELALKQELLEREMVIKHLHYVIDDLDKQQQQQQQLQQQQDVDSPNNSGDVDTVANVDEPVAAAAAVVDSAGTVDDSAAAAVAAVAAAGKEWGRESRRREKKEEKEEREREKREQREQREREKRENRASLGGSGSGSGKAGRKKESKAAYDEARRQLEQERKEHRLASNFLRSQCELLEAQKVAAEESFAQLRQTLEKEIVDARTRCLELERLRFAPEEVGDSRTGHLRHQTGPAALSHRPSADAGAD